MNNPIYSMTAYARHQTDFQTEQLSGHFTWELRSVNQRYLEPHFKLPDTLRHLEPKIREVLKTQLARGKVDIICHLHLQQNAPCFQINQPLLNQLKSAIETTQKTFPSSAKINLLEALQWPGVLQIQEAKLDETIENQLLEQFSVALTQLKAHRQREGQALGKVILQRCEQIEQQLDKVQPLLPQIREQHLQQLQTKLSTLGEKFDPQRLHQEAAILAQKIDIDEELQRLITHLSEVRHILQTDQPKGRRLDFLMQELNREANTLGSKSIDARTSQASVELKVLIEQMREQIQNIE